jgi:hypothetical protein
MLIINDLLTNKTIYFELEIKKVQHKQITFDSVTSLFPIKNCYKIFVYKI